MKQLVLTEKRKVGEMFAAALEPDGSRTTYAIEGENYVITWAKGHLFELVEPGHYESSLRKFDLATLPIEPDHYEFAPIKGCEKQIDALKQLFSRDDISSVTIATDCGREGELIGRLCLRYCGWDISKDTFRFWTSAALTKENILLGMANRIPAKEKVMLFDSGLARMYGDWQVGINATRALTCRLKTGQAGIIPTGRIQGPTLKLIMQRQLERESFIPEDFWTIRGRFNAEGHDEIIASWVGFSGGSLEDCFLPENEDEDVDADEIQSRRFKNIYEANARINAICKYGMTHKALKDVLKISPHRGAGGETVQATIIGVVGADRTVSSGIRGEPGPKRVPPPAFV
ncbi:MAG: hypothetical protein JXQ81_12095 [Desulfuromonadales bacterium]|nr:hypothetical protein [Desulfuromonadales bacterium]MBN2793240.1 hypothetical protein [Desulfuromonadales bacterium]